MSESDISPPPYNSIAADSRSPYRHGDNTSSPHTGEVLSNRLNTARENHIQTIISNHILPILERRTELGLSRTSVALLPVNIAVSTSKEADDNGFTKPTYKVIDIVSGHDGDEDLQHIKLSSAVDTTQFWSQPAVLVDLRQSLRDRLNSRPEILKLQPPSFKTEIASPPPVPSPPPPTPATPSKQRRSFFSRRSSSKEQYKNIAPAAVQNSDGLPVSPGEFVTVVVQPEEICLRTQSDFGLYQTLTRPAVVVRVLVRGR